MSARDEKTPYFVEEHEEQQTSEDKPVELRKKPTLSMTWEKAKELLNLE